MARTADDFIMMRTSKTEKEAIKEAADGIGMSMSAFILNAVRIEVMRLQEGTENVNEQK